MKDERKRGCLDMNYYISDLHLFHDNIINKLDKRGFSSMDEMVNYIINKWNNKITESDDVYILGDFSFGKPAETMDVLRRLNGRKHLVKGNHEKYLNHPEFDRSLFASIKDYMEIKDGKDYVVLCHYPILFYKHQYRNSYMLYGHIHNTQDARFMEIVQKEFKKFRFNGRDGEAKIPAQHINCFCMFSDYEPLSLKEWVDKCNDRKG